MSSITNLSAGQLRQAANLKEKIQALKTELNHLLGSTGQPAADAVRKKKGGMSAAGKAKIAAAQKARWAKVKAAKPAAKAQAVKAVVVARPAKKKFTMSAAAKARISAAAKARWAKIKGAKK